MSGPWQAVLFDVEGVIAHRDDAATEDALGRRWPGLTIDAVQASRNNDRLYPLWQTFSCGALSSTSYWAAVLADLGVDVTDDSVEAMRRIQEQTAWAIIDQEVLSIAGRLRECGGFRLGILSNSSIDYEEHILRFESLFDVVCFSHRTGQRKPDADAYVGAAEALGVPLASIVFLDDKKRNIDAAERLGMRAVHVVDSHAVARGLAALDLIAGDA